MAACVPRGTGCRGESVHARSGASFETPLSRDRRGRAESPTWTVAANRPAHRRLFERRVCSAFAICDDTRVPRVWPPRCDKTYPAKFYMRVRNVPSREHTAGTGSAIEDGGKSSRRESGSGKERFLTRRLPNSSSRKSALSRRFRARIWRGDATPAPTRVLQNPRLVNEQIVNSPSRTERGR